VDGSPKATQNEAFGRLEASVLKHRVRSGAGATAVAQAVGQVLQIATVAVLYRLLRPEDFGLFWMLVSVLLVLRIFCTMGLNIGAVQETNLTPQQTSILFWLTLAFGLATTVVTAALGPAVAAFYGQPRLLWLTVAMAGTSLLIALSAQHQALLERSLRLSELATLRIVAQFVGGLAAVVAALLDGGVWSLAVQWYAELALLTAGVWWLEPWRPERQLGLASARHLIRFGGYLSAAVLIFTLGQNVDKILVGRLLGPLAEGFYGQAFSWMMKPVNVIVPPVASLLLPALARSTHDPALYRQVWFSFSRLVGAVLMPTAIGMAIVAPEGMLVLGGEKWIEAGYLLRVLALSAAAQAFLNLAGSVLASVGRSDRLFVASIIMLVVLLVAYALGFVVGSALGSATMGIAASYTIAIGLLFVPYMAFCLSAASISLRDWLRVLLPLAAPALGMGMFVLAVRSLLLALAVRPLSLLAIEVLSGAALFPLLARRQLGWVLGQVRTLLAGRQ
jgi:PST family polysaccharide transporter